MIVRAMSLRLINRYQTLGGSRVLFRLECNFIPTCSEYTKQAIIKYGAMRGWSLGLKRISRCSQRDLVDVMIDEVP
ncbi:membrane protein insertion efficiency factor YidD [Vibrio sp. PNB22_3_1]